MGYTLGQILKQPSKESIRSDLLGILQGRGLVQRVVGACGGGFTLEGMVTAAASCQVKVVTSGQPFTCSVQVSTDGGATFGSPVTPTTDDFDGLVTIGSTGITARLSPAFPNDPSVRDFLAGTIFSFELALPLLPVTAWQEGSTPLTMVEVFSQAIEDVFASVYGVAAGGIIPYSTGLWLDLLGSGVYDLERQPAATARHSVRFTAVSGAGPYVVPAGQLIATTAGALIFRSIAGVTIPAGGSVTATLQADGPGAAYNVGLGAINQLVTVLPGVTCVNVDTGNSSSIVDGYVGADAETDDSYQSRCRARWPTLGLGATAQTYDLACKAASPGVNRTQAVPSGDGLVSITLAGPAGPADPSTVTAVQAYLDGHVPLCVVATAASATTSTVNVIATVYVERGKVASIRPAILARLNALILAVPIGGTLYLSQIIDAIQGVSGVRNTTVGTPSGNVVLTAHQVAVPSSLTGLTFVEV